MIPARLAVTPGSSVLHRLPAGSKVLAVAAISTTLAFRPTWSALAIGAGVICACFLLGRLPLGVLSRPPKALLAVLALTVFFSLDTGGDPTWVGMEWGGIVQLARLVAVGFEIVLLAGVLAWTTTLAELGLGLTRLLRPLRLLRVPVDELATVVSLAVRAIPLLGTELGVVLDARRTRPAPAAPTSGPRWRRARGPLAAADAIEIGVAVVVSAYRRAGELADAMTIRNSCTAPLPERRRIGLGDVLTVLVAGAVCTCIVTIG